MKNILKKFLQTEQ